MNVRMPFQSLAIVTLAATLVSPLVATDAMAAKTKFERTKPHVNVGTIGNVDQSPGSLASPQGNGAALPDDSRPDDPDCVPDPSKPADTQSC